jgi:hydroxypyruvate reductase
VGNNRIAAESAIREAERSGYQAELLTSSLTGEAREVGKEYGAMLRMLSEDAARKPVMWVAGGETTVTITGTGIGGRNQELALAAVEEIADLPNAAVVTLATDGGDGPTEAAGAVVTGETLARAQQLGMHPTSYLADNDSYHFFLPLGDCLLPGPTRTNVNDLLFLFSW